MHRAILKSCQGEADQAAVQHLPMSRKTGLESCRAAGRPDRVVVQDGNTAPTKGDAELNKRVS